MTAAGGMFHIRIRMPLSMATAHSHSKHLLKVQHCPGLSAAVAGEAIALKLLTIQSGDFHVSGPLESFGHFYKRGQAGHVPYQ